MPLLSVVAFRGEILALALVAAPDRQRRQPAHRAPYPLAPTPRIYPRAEAVLWRTSANASSAWWAIGLWYGREYGTPVDFHGHPGTGEWRKGVRPRDGEYCSRTSTWRSAAGIYPRFYPRQTRRRPRMPAHAGGRNGDHGPTGCVPPCGIAHAARVLVSTNHGLSRTLDAHLMRETLSPFFSALCGGEHTLP
jgi:hypothetical protein